MEKKNDEIASVCKVDTEPETTDEESVRDAFQNDALDTTQGENIQEAEQNENEQQNDNE